MYRVSGSSNDAMCQQQGEFIDFEKSACNVNRSFDHSRGVVIDSVVLVPVLATTTAKPLQVAFFDTAPTLVLPHIHCQCESPVVTSASSVVTTEFSITPPPKIMRASGSHAFDARLTVFKDQNLRTHLMMVSCFQLPLTVFTLRLLLKTTAMS